MRVWLILFFLLMFASSVSAVTINEIMYNPPSHLGGSSAEWIELYNSESFDVNISGWFVADPSNHTITEGNLVISASSYLVISKSAFFDDFSNYYNASAESKAGFALTNSGEVINIIDSNGTVIDSVTYSSSWGADGNNYSLQWNGTGFCEGNSTPGTGNSCLTITEEVNQTQNETVQESPTIVNCSGVSVVNLTYYPESLKFGYSDKVKIDFNSSCYNFNTTKVLVYGSSSRVVSYENGSKIKKYADCENGSLFEDLENKSYSWKIPFFTYPNCDDRYSSDNYTLSLRVCSLDEDNDWRNYYEETFIVKFSGENSTTCGGFVEEIEKVAEKVNETSVEPSKVKSTREKTNLVEGVKEVIYESTDKGNLKISVYLLGALLVLLVAYLIMSKDNI